MKRWVRIAKTVYSLCVFLSIAVCIIFLFVFMADSIDVMGGYGGYFHDEYWGYILILFITISFAFIFYGLYQLGVDQEYNENKFRELEKELHRLKKPEEHTDTANESKE